MSQERPSRRGATNSDDYSAVYYHDYSGPPYTYDEQHWKSFFGRIADEVVAVFEPRSSYDAGCAKGFMVRALAERGVDARGGDISSFAIADAPAGLAERLEVKDLTEPFDRRYDVITCVEVLEHMEPGDARIAVANMCAAADVVVLSTTPDNFSEPTHVNIRQPAGWAQDFAAKGFFRRTDVDASFVSPWAVVFAKQQLTAVDLLVRYETLLQPTLREVQEKRQALLDLRRQLDEAAAPVMLERDALLEKVASLSAERDALTAERDEAVRQRDAMSTELEEFRGAEVVLARLAVVDELMGAQAELAQLRIHTENSITDAGREASRLRDMLATATNEAARVRHEAAEALRQADARSAEADELVLAVTQDRERALADVRSSTSWRIGQAALLPVRLTRKLRRRWTTEQIDD